MIEENKRRKISNIVFVIAIILLVFSCFFERSLSEFLYLKPNYRFNNNTELHFINVGQGDAIAIKFDNGKTMLIDTGTDIYRPKLKYYLDNIILEGSNKIDFLVLTHIDLDHSGNMMYILENYEIGEFFRPKIYSLYEDNSSINTSTWYDKIINYCFYNNISMRFNEAGLKLSVGFTELTWISPINLNHNDLVDSNDFSPIIKLEYNNHKALLTGDVSEQTEKELINNYTDDFLDIDILKIAHHGSQYSTSEEFLNVTSPDYACICVGENTYGHPSNALLDRILKYDKVLGKKLFNNTYTTLEDGNVIFTLDDEIDINCISNIDSYSFICYYTCVLLFILILTILYLIPYMKIWKKKIRFVLQNKRFKKLFEKKNKISQN